MVTVLSFTFIVWTNIVVWVCRFSTLLQGFLCIQCMLTVLSFAFIVWTNIVVWVCSFSTWLQGLLCIQCMVTVVFLCSFSAGCSFTGPLLYFTGAELWRYHVLLGTQVSKCPYYMADMVHELWLVSLPVHNLRYAKLCLGHKARKKTRSITYGTDHALG